MRLLGLLLCLALPGVLTAQQHRPRARDLGIPFPGETGPHNAITDVAGVTVGQVTLNSGSGKLVQGKGPIRTGVTLVHPRGGDWSRTPSTPPRMRSTATAR